MPQDIILRPEGVWSDPNPFGGVPAGALRTADDVVLRRKGIIEPRPHFEDATTGTKPSTYVANMVPFDDHILAWLQNGNWVWHDAVGTAVTGISGRVFSASKHIGVAYMRGSMYLAPGEDTLYKCASVGASSIDRVALLPPGQPSAAFSTRNTWLAAGDYVAYRIVARVEDGNGYVRRSAPSGRLVVGGSGSDASITLTLVEKDWHPADVVYEVYRTVSTSSDAPADEYFLAGEVEGSGSGTLSYDDQVPDDGLGSALYTNASQEGALQENSQPPRCEDVAEYRGSLFFADTATAFSRVMRVAGVDGRAFNHSVVTSDGAVLAGQDIIPIGSSLASLSVGDVIVDQGSEPGEAGTYFSADTTITDIDLISGEITIDKPILANSAGNITMAAGPWIDVGEIRVYGWSALNLSPAVSGNYQIDALQASPREVVEGLAYVYSRVDADVHYEAMSVGPDTASLLIRQPVSDSGPIEILGSGPNGLDPPLDDTVAIETERDVRPNRLYWSKSQQPEAVPIANFVDIGSEDSAIVRIVPTRDALWVLKEDGVWRLTGAGADSGWRVDPYDPSIRPLARKAVTRLGDDVYVWSAQGVYAIGLRGTRNVSEDMIGASLASAVAERLERGPDESGNRATWMAAYEREGEILLSPGGYTTGTWDDVWILNTRTMAWTRWTLNAVASVETREYLWIAPYTSATEVNIQRPSGSATHTSITPVVEFQARTLDVPSMLKRWGRTYLTLQDSEGAVASVDVSYTSDVSDTAWTEAGATLTEDGAGVYHHPFFVPREHCLSGVLYPRFAFNQETGATPWKLLAYRCEASPSSPSPRRTEG